MDDFVLQVEGLFWIELLEQGRGADVFAELHGFLGVRRS